jgi:hypothetical protein
VKQLPLLYYSFSKLFTYFVFCISKCIIEYCLNPLKSWWDFDKNYTTCVHQFWENWHCHYLEFPKLWMRCARVLSHFSHVRLFATLWTIAHQAPLSMGFSRQEYWSGLTFPSPVLLNNMSLFTHITFCLFIH